MELSVTEIVTRVIKYLLEGLAVAVAMIIIPRRIPQLEEIVSVSIVAALVFAILDLLSPSVGLTARQGAGFGLGANLVGFPGGGMA
jgi:ABC-type Co2+ transport system permease subunit